MNDNTFSFFVKICFIFAWFLMFFIVMIIVSQPRSTTSARAQPLHLPFSISCEIYKPLHTLNRRLDFLLYLFSFLFISFFFSFLFFCFWLFVFMLSAPHVSYIYTLFLTVSYKIYRVLNTAAYTASRRSKYNIAKNTACTAGITKISKYLSRKQCRRHGQHCVLFFDINYILQNRMYRQHGQYMFRNNSSRKNAADTASMFCPKYFKSKI